MLAANNHGFATPTAPLFFSLLVSGLKEAGPKDNLNLYTTLKKLSSKILTYKFIEHFKKYIEIQKERVESKRDFKTWLHQLVNADRTFDRGIELSTLIHALIKGESKHTYSELLDNSLKVSNKANSGMFWNYNRGSELLSGLMDIIEKAQEYIDNNKNLYEQDCSDYKGLHTTSDGTAQEKMRENLERQEMEIQD